MLRLSVAAILAATVACDAKGGRVPAEPARDAAPRSASPDAGRDGGVSCVRDGSLDAIERTGECLAPCADVADPRVVATTLESSKRAALPGAASALTARIKNVSARPVTICLRVESSEPLGWDRIAGVTAPVVDRACEHPRLVMALRTIDRRDADVDDLKVGSRVLCASTLRVILPPGRSLTKSLVWVATRLPPPPRPWEDDAGHRFYPKDSPVPLTRGSYRVETDIPFFDGPPELTRVAVTMDVESE